MMSHFTTGTSSFVLSKYSRSYPLKRPAHKVQLSAQPGPEFSSEWQHFTNPVIRLVLDVKTNSDADMESVKLRILWEINNGIEACANSQSVVFASLFSSLGRYASHLDLLSFSAPTFGRQGKDQAEGLPLKAVYRDTVVGIRYLHSREDGNNMPIYRRFQISFQKPSEASEFIQTIKPICPCKLNPNSIPGPALSQMHTLPIRPVIPSTTAANSVLPSRTTSPACPPPPLPLAKRKSSMHQRTASALPSSSDQLLTSHVQAMSGTSVLGLSLNPLHQPSQTNAIPVITQNLPASSLPNSSLPSSDNSAAMGALSVRGHSSEPAHPIQTVQPILTILEESMSIYNLPNSEVEMILSEILHEEGFVQLVERISGMLMVQTLLNG